MRIWNPEHIIFITNRCEQERLFLLPRRRITSLIGGWLAKALLEHGDGIEVYAFIFLSNHFHILLRDTKGRLAEFMWYFQLNLAKAVNRELGRAGHFFSREYDAAPVLTNEDFEDRYAYILTNAVKAGLLAKAAGGPFFSSLPMALEEKSLSFEWEDRTRRHNRSRRGQKVERAEVTRRYPLELSVPPMWREWTRARRRRRIVGLVAANEARYGQERRAEGRSVLDVHAIFSQSPLSRPRNPARGPRVRVFCRDAELAREFLDGARTLVAAYQGVLEAFRRAAAKGRRCLVEWPPWTYAPSTMRPVLAA